MTEILTVLDKQSGRTGGRPRGMKRVFDAKEARNDAAKARSPLRAPRWRSLYHVLTRWVGRTGGDP